MNITQEIIDNAPEGATHYMIHEENEFNCYAIKKKYLMYNFVCAQTGALIGDRWSPYKLPSKKQKTKGE